MHTITILTGSIHKFSELDAMLSCEGLKFARKDIDLIEIQELDADRIMQHKLKEATKHIKGEFIIDDTSLYIDALKGFPGPLVKWMERAMHDEGLANIISRLDTDRATVCCILGYGNTRKKVFKTFHGVVHGKIVPLKGKRLKGFGFNTIFIPDGHKERYAEMSEEKRNACNHRGLAARKLKGFLVQKSR